MPGSRTSCSSADAGEWLIEQGNFFPLQSMHMRPHAESHQLLQPGNGHWKLKVWHSSQLTGPGHRNLAEYVQSPLGGSDSWGP